MSHESCGPHSDHNHSPFCSPATKQTPSQLLALILGYKAKVANLSNPERSNFQYLLLSSIKGLSQMPAAAQEVMAIGFHHLTASFHEPLTFLLASIPLPKFGTLPSCEAEPSSHHRRYSFSHLTKYSLSQSPLQLWPGCDPDPPIGHNCMT